MSEHRQHKTFDKAKFPLLFRTSWNASGLAESLACINPDALCAEYRALVECAPHRSERGKRYFVLGHDGVTESAGQSNRREEHYAIALFQLGARWPRSNGGWFSLLDYQVPLKARQGDSGIGKIDLVGATDKGRLIVSELKVQPSSGRGEAPPVGLMEGLRYAAIVEANLDVFAKEAKECFDVTIINASPIIQLLAPLEWWNGWLNLPRQTSGDWKAAFVRLTRDVEAKLDITVECIALDKAGLNDDGTFDGMPALHIVRLDQTHSVGDALPQPQGGMDNGR